MRRPPRLGLVPAAFFLAGWLGAGVVIARPAAAQPVSAQPLGELTYAMHVTVASAWFDPAENTGIATPFMVQEALHDALVKPILLTPEESQR